MDGPDPFGPHSSGIDQWSRSTPRYQILRPGVTSACQQSTFRANQWLPHGHVNPPHT
jgi:hypothetical protein